MTRSEVEAVVGRALQLEEPVEAGCIGIGGTVTHQALELFVEFTSSGDTGSLRSIFAPLASRPSKEELVQALKRRVPTLVYQPSRHAPEVLEAENPKPLYVLASNPSVGVLVGPAEGIWIVAPVRCVD